MRIVPYAAALVIIASPVSASDAQAADGPVIKTGRPSTVAHRHRGRAAGAYKLIGMPCLLPPDVIVAWNWNGPQCRYVDNLILPHARFVGP